MEYSGGTIGFSGSREAEPSTDGSLAAPPDPEDAHAVDEQLTAILEVIRSWDWRAGIFSDDGTLKQATGPTGQPVPAPDPLSFSGLFIEPSVDAIESHDSRAPEVFPASDPRPLIEDPLEALWAPKTAPTPAIVVAAPPPPAPAPPFTQVPPPPAPAPSLVESSAATTATPPAEVAAPTPARTSPVTVESEPSAFVAPPERSVPEPTVEPPAPASHISEPTIATAARESFVAVPAAAAVGVAAAGAVATAPTPDPPRSRPPEVPTPPRWWAKYVLWVGAAVIVVLIVAIIRSNSPGSTSGPSLPSSPISANSAVPKTTVQVSKAELNQFTTISQTLDTANVAATSALAGGDTQTVAQVATEVTPYLTALDTFNFDLHLMTWPTALQRPSRNLVLRTQSLATFVVSELSANATNLSTWFAQFHALAQETQAADNVLRHDVGLPVTSTYP